jgi:magnesium chelatase accessory protein
MQAEMAAQMAVATVQVNASSAGASEPVSWQREGADWPLRAHSRFVASAGLTWHVQQLGSGPPLLLVHGTGSATHSWHRIAPLLAQHYAVTSLDLPGHGFTEGTPIGGLSLPAISTAVGTLLRTLGLQPQLAIGHSAGAAILCRMALDGLIAPRLIISLNGALLRLRGAEWLLFAPLARLLATSVLPAKLFAWAARDRAAVERLVASTGSRLPPEDVDLYWRLVRNPAHVDGALRMMAAWDLVPLERELPRMKTPLALLVGEGDRTVPPGEATRVRTLLPQSTCRVLPGLGHLAHEEQPVIVANAINALVQQCVPEGLAHG